MSSQKVAAITGASRGIGAGLVNAYRKLGYAVVANPVGRMGDISDVIDAITYLETAGFVTGEIIHVDGGQSAGH